MMLFKNLQRKMAVVVAEDEGHRAEVEVLGEKVVAGMLLRVDCLKQPIHSHISVILDTIWLGGTNFVIRHSFYAGV